MKLAEECESENDPEYQPSEESDDSLEYDSETEREINDDEVSLKDFNLFSNLKLQVGESEVECIEDEIEKEINDDEVSDI